MPCLASSLAYADSPWDLEGKFLPRPGYALQLPTADMACLSSNELRGYELDHTIVIETKTEALLTNSKSNPFVTATAAGKPHHDWLGPIIVLRYEAVPDAQGGFVC
jgi:hypothetical protein